jgi:hypothetical protein
MNGGTSTPASAATSNLKRPRQSAGMAAPGVAGPSATSSRVKRRKNELDDGAGESSEAGGRGRGGSSMAVAGKGKEEDGGESGEIQTKVRILRIGGILLAVLTSRLTSRHYQSRRYTSIWNTMICCLNGRCRLGQRIYRSLVSTLKQFLSLPLYPD